MSESQSAPQLASLSKEDIKKLEKMAYKAKRDEEAKTAKTGPSAYASIGKTVSFDAPIRGSNDDRDRESMRLMNVLGRYEDMSSMIMSDRTGMLMGVDRQPATPLPGKKGAKNVFNELSKNKQPVSAGSSKMVPRNITENTKNSSARDSSSSSSARESMKAPSADSKNRSTVPSQSANHRTEERDSSSQKGYRSSKSNSHSAQAQTDQRHQSKTQTTHTREPVLQEIGKELTEWTKSSTKHPSSKSAASRTNAASETRPPVDHISVLQVKEENRNDAVVNGRNRHRPRIQIPEKNVEDMLKELTQVPQPLTAIQTPLKDAKFPFQDNKVNTKEEANKEFPQKPRPHANRELAIPNKTAPAVSGDEDHDKDDSSDEEDECGNDNSSDGSSSGSESEKEEGEVKSDHSDTERSEVKEKKAISTEPAHQQVPTTGSVSVSGTSSMPVKGQRDTMSSSESSGSESDSSDGSSDSESDEHEPVESEKPSTPQKVNLSPDSMDPSPSKPTWALKAFFQPNPQLINMNSKHQPFEAPASDQFDEVIDVKRSADNISDENIPSVGQENVCKPMSADEFSPPAPVDKCVLSPIKSPQPIKSPVKRKISAIDNTLATKSKETRSPYQNKSNDTAKHKEKKTSVTKPSPDVKETGSRRGRKPKPKSVAVIDSCSSDSDSDLETSVSYLSESLQKSLPLSPPQKSRTVKSKRDKLKEKDSVKLKKKSPAVDIPSKTNHCDTKILYNTASAKSRPQESIDKMLDSFSRETPLSPIPNVPRIPCQDADLRKAGLTVSPVKPIIPLNGVVGCVNGKASVLVQLDLDLLKKILPVDLLKTRTNEPKGSFTPKHEGAKNPKLTPVKESSHKVLDNKKVSLSSQHSKGFILSDSSKGYGHSDNHSKSTKVTESVHSEDKSDDVVMPDFDSLPVHENSYSRSQLSDESSSGSSCSDSEEDKPSARTSHLCISSVSTDNKKRKVDEYRVDDSKRRKTSAKSPRKQFHTEAHKKYSENVGGYDERREREPPPPKKSSSKRERHSSSSSQLSTHSHVSSHSQGGGSHKSRRSIPLTASTPHDSQFHDLTPRSTTSAASPTHKHPIKAEQIEPVKENGFASAPPPCPDSTTATRVLESQQDDITFKADWYHRQAKKYKYQADAMDPGLPRYLFYLESVLSFMQCGYALEKEGMVNDAASMYKETQKYVIHHGNQFRGHHDANAPELKLTVLCYRIQSLVYLKLYLLKKKESMKLKKILEDHNNKSVKSTTSQPKPPSAPSPLQTNWNRSTGTPSPMSPTPSPASVGSVGSVGSDHTTPSKLTNGSSSSAAVAPSGSVMIPQRIHTITQKYFTYTNFIVQAYEMWEQADAAITPDIRDFFAHIDMECGALTLHSNLPHLVKYVKTAIVRLDK